VALGYKKLYLVWYCRRLLGNPTYNAKIGFEKAG